MSMFSIASSRLTFGRATVCSNGIEVHHHQVDRLDAVRANRRLVVCVAAEVEQPAVNLGVERLHPAVQHFRKTGVGAQVGDVQARLAQRLGGAAGGNQFHTCRRQRLGQRDESRLIGNRKQCASNLLHNRALPSSRAARQVNRQYQLATTAAFSDTIHTMPKKKHLLGFDSGCAVSSVVEHFLDTDAKQGCCAKIPPPKPDRLLARFSVLLCLLNRLRHSEFFSSVRIADWT